MRALGLAALAVLACVAAARAEGLPLAEAVERALGRAAAIEAAEAGRRQAEEGAREAARARLPVLSARAGAARGDQPVYAFGELLAQRRLEARDMALARLNYPGYVTSLGGGLELGVPLFVAFELRSARRSAALSARQAGFAREEVEQALRARVLELFVAALARERLAAVLTERLASSSRELEEARRLKERGLVLGSDYFAAEAVRSGLSAKSAALARELQGLKEALATLTGSPASPAGTLGEADYALSYREDLLREALEGRPELKAARAEREKTAVLRRRAAASWLPRVEAFAALDADTHDASYLATSRTAGVRARLPFGDPGYGPRVAGAEAAEASAAARTRALEDAARIELAGALAAYLGAVDSLPDLARMREAAGESLERVRPLYKEGRQSVLDVLRAEEAAVRAEEALLGARAGAHAGYARVLLAAGRLDAKAIEEVARRLGARR